MGIYGQSVFGNTNNFENTLSSFNESINSYRSYSSVVEELLETAFSELNNYESLMGVNESDESLVMEAKAAGKFSIKTIWEGIKKFVLRIWEFIKDIPNKVKAFFGKFKQKQIEDDFDEFFDDFEDEFPNEDLKVEPNKTEEQYQNEIDRLKSEIESLKSELGNSEKENENLRNSANSNDRRNKLNVKRNELHVLKIKKAIKHILENDILYWSPFILLNSYQIDLSNYKRYAIGYIDTIDDLNNLVKFDEKSIDSDESEIKNFLTTLVRPEVAKLDDVSGFKLGGFDHYKLNDYAKEQMALRRKQKPITDIKSITEAKIYFDQTGELERLLINLRDIIGLLNSKIQKVTPLDPNDTAIFNSKKDKSGLSYIKSGKIDGEPDTYIHLTKKQARIIQAVKDYIRGLECASQVVSVAAKFQGQYIGTLKTSAIALKALV